MPKDYSRLGEFEERFGREFALEFYDALQQCQQPQNLDYIFRQYSYDLEVLNRVLSYEDEGDDKLKADFITKYAEAIRSGKPLVKPDLAKTPAEPAPEKDYGKLYQEYMAGEYGDHFKKRMQAIDHLGVTDAEKEQLKRQWIDEWPKRVEFQRTLDEHRSKKEDLGITPGSA